MRAQFASVTINSYSFFRTSYVNGDISSTHFQYSQDANYSIDTLINKNTYNKISEPFLYKEIGVLIEGNTPVDLLVD